MTAVGIFLATVYALCGALSLTVWLGVSARAGYLAMFLPAVSIWIVKAVTGDGVILSWEWPRLKWILPALFLMPVLMHAAMLPAMLWLEGPPHWLEVPGAAAMAAKELAGLLFVSVLAFFEEIGWRSWLLPRLQTRLGTRAAIAATAVIWGVWHIPLAVSGILRIEGVPPALTAVTLPAGVAGSGLILGWLWVRTESIWVVSLAHGSMNHWGQMAFRYMRDSGRPETDLKVLAFGMAAVTAAGLILMSRCGRRLCE